MKKIEERRKWFRLPSNSEGRCYVGTDRYTGTVGDLSIMGFYMETENTQLLVNTELDVEIVFNGDHSRLVMDKLRGKVVRKDIRGIGVEFANRLEWLALVPIYFPKLKEK